MSSRSLQQVTAFFLLIILGGNLFLSLFWSQWQAAISWHNHIILGPVAPGWEDHHHPASWSHWARHSHSRSRQLPSFVNKSVHLIKRASGAGSKVISVYPRPAGDSTILSFGVQLLWLAGWALMADRPAFVWTLDLTAPDLSNIFLPPPQKPPSPFLQGRVV